MSIASSLEALQAAKSNIASAITAKGGTVNAGDGLSDFASDIGTIPAGAYAIVNVTAPTGSTVVCTKGTKTVTAQEDSGVWLFRLPEFGVWTVTATKDGDSASDTVYVQQDYEATLSYKPTASLIPKSGVTYTNGIAALTAEQMSSYGEAISNNSNITNETSEVYVDSGDLHYKISTGDSINWTVSGAAYEFIVVGFNHDELTDSAAYGAETATGKSGFTLHIKNCLNTPYKYNIANTAAGGWNECYLRATLQSTIKPTMDGAWQSAFKMVKKLTADGNASSNIVESNDTLFAPSEIEIFGRLIYSASGEGCQYAWYKAGNSKLKSVNGISVWWERSPTVSYSGQVCVVKNGYDGRYNSSQSVGVAFAVCI